MRKAAVLSVASAVITLSVAGGTAAQSAADCDRACLGDVMTAFLDSLVAHDPSRAPLAQGARFTEDAVQLPIGEGLWKTATSVGPYRSDFLDPQTGTAAVQAVVEEQRRPVLFAARLRVENRRITEIETMVVRDQQEGVLFAPDGLAEASAAMNTPPPRDALLPREAMVDIALRYPEGLRVGSFERSDVPFASDAYRLENGVRMAGPGCTFRPPSCEDMRGQQLPTLAEIESRVVAVDEQNGTVLLWMDFGAGSLPGPQTAGQSLVTFEAFKVYGGQVHAVEAIFQGMPANSSTGWEPAAGTAWPVRGVDAPTTELVLEAFVTLSPAVEVGQSDAGVRRFIPITGGRFVGDGIRGEVMAGGADWQLERPDGVLEVNALYSIRTDDGVTIVVDNQGIIVPGTSAADGQPGRAPYVRTTPRFHAPRGKYDWLNKGVFVGGIAPGAGGGAVVIRVFRVL